MNPLAGRAGSPSDEEERQVTARGDYLRVLACLVALQAAGCASRPAVYAVKGRVTFNGRAVTTGTVVFHALDDKLPLVRGEIREGSFELTTYRPGDGAPAGKYQVTVHAFRPGKGVEGWDADYQPPRPLVPLKYTRLDQTPLAETVEPRENRLDLALKE
jgi:hypothetical protein